MSRHIPSVYRPVELKAAIAALTDTGFEERTAISVIKKLHELGFRIIKVTP